MACHFGKPILKLLTMRNLLFLLSFIVLYSCNTNKQEAVAIVDGKTINLKQIDNIIHEQLFHMLEGIFLLRQQALDEYINQLVIAEEAKKQNSSVEELLNKNIMPKLADSLVDKRASELLGFVADMSDPHKIYDCKTEFGRNYLKKSMLIEEKAKYAQSLRDNHTIDIFLSGPDKFRPKVSLKDIEINFKGNLKSDFEFILIGNSECDGCKQAKPIMDSLFSKYGDKIKFGYCYYSNQPSLASIAVEAAGLQDKYWEMHEMTFAEDNNPDTTTVMEYASKLDLDLTKFNNGLNSSEIKTKIENNINIIADSKIITTPTIVINGNVFNAPFLQYEMEEFIDKLLR